MTSLFYYLYFKNIMIFVIIVYLITVIGKAYQNRQKVYSKECLYKYKDNFLVVMKYLDYYYITNIYYTLFAVILYVSFTVFIFIYLRYYFIGHYVIIVNAPLFIFNVQSLIVLIIFALCFICYKRFFDIVFYPHVIRLHFYLYHNKYYQIWLDFERLHYHLGSYLDSYIVSLDKALNFEYDLQNEDLKWLEKKLNPCAAQKRAKWHSFFRKHKIIYWIFKYPIYKILWFISSSSGFFFYYVPHMIVCYSFLYDIYHNNLYYIYYALFYFVIINAFDKIRYFLHVKDPVYDDLIYNYFYKGEVPYKKVRHYIINNHDINISVNRTIRERVSNVMSDWAELLSYLEQDLKVYYILDRDKAFDTQWSFMYYLQVHLVILYLIVGSFAFYYCSYKLFFYSVELPRILLCCLIPLMAYFTSKITQDPLIKERVNKRSRRFFWFITGTQGILFYIILFKSALTLPENEVLFDFIFTITKTYSLEDKIMYLFQYFEHYIAHTGLTSEDQELLRYNLRTIDFKEIINEQTTLKDIMYNVKIYIQTEYYQNNEEVQAIERDIVKKEELMKELFTNPLYKILRNFIIIGVISIGSLKIIMYYSDLLEVIKQLSLDPYGIHLIGQKTMFNIFGNGPLKVYTYAASYVPDIVDLILINKVSDVIHVGLAFLGVGFTLLSKPFEKPASSIEILNEDATYVVLPELEATMSLTNTSVLFVGSWTIFLITCLAFMVFLKRNRNRNHGTKEKLT